MKLTINTVKLQEMLLKAVKGASCNKIQPITNLICLQYQDSEFTLITTDGTNYLYIMDNDVNGEDFYIVVGVEQFSKLVSKLTSEFVTLELQDGALTVVGNGTYNIEIPLDENGEYIQYPDPLRTVQTDFTEHLELSTVHTILNTIKPSLAVTMELPVITRYYVGDIVVATDSFKAAGYNKEVFQDATLITPQLMNLLDVMTDDIIDVMITETDMVFSTDTCVIYSTVMSGVEQYPLEVIKSLLTEEFTSTCRINRNNFVALLERIQLFVGTQDNDAIRMTFTEDGISVTNINSKSSELIEYVQSKNYQPFTCLINVESLLSQVKVYSTEVLELQYGNDSSIKLVDGDITQVICLDEEV